MKLRWAKWVCVLICPAFLLGVSPQENGGQLEIVRQEEEENYYQKWLNEDAFYIITQDEKDVFGKLQTDEEKEQFIEQFWFRRDLDPTTAANEFKEEHYRRIAYANERFRSGVRGWKTDRGRIYIIHGPPVEIEKHFSGESYVRPSHEGGGLTSVVPFEIWRYRHIEGIGSDVELEFVDPSRSGEFRLARTPWEKDEQLMLMGAGQTMAEEAGLATRGDHPYFTSTNWDRYPGMVARAKDNPFTRYETFIKVQRPVELKYPDLKEIVEVDISFNKLPFQVRESYFQLSSDQILVPVTLEVENKDLSFVQEGPTQMARVAVYGLITSMTNRFVSEFEDDLVVSFPAQALSIGIRNRSTYQKVITVEGRMRYRLDLVVKDKNSGNVGVIRKGIIPPPFSGDELGSSSLVLSDFVRQVREDSYDEMFVIGDVKIRPNLKRTFSGKKPFWVYLHVYNPAVDQATIELSLSVAYRILRDGQTLVERIDENGESIQFSSGSRVVLLKYLPLGSLKAGTYRMEVEVEDRVGQKKLSVGDSFEIET
ncbi:MAG TPA: GWxTD domain-containing protein [Acidobacteriota bacterium]|nr:GWxTD domain-containing protein [Acidobacteriota bacterium]